METNVNKLKVCILAPYVPISEHIGGLDIHIHKTIEYLSARDDIELYVLTIGNHNGSFRQKNLVVYSIQINKAIRFPLYILAAINHLRRKTIEINPDVVHAVGSFAIYSTTGALLRKKFPTVLTVVSLAKKSIEFYHGKFFLLFTRFITIPNERYVVSRIPNIILQSTHVERLVREMTKSKTYVVPEGIELNNHSSAQILYSSEKNSDIFLATRLVKLKGIDTLIKAVSLVTKQIPDIKVYLAGSGEEEEPLKNLVRDLGLNNNVRFLGFISDTDELNSYYQACKMVVTPSRMDSEPFAPLNAAAAGKPSIISDKANSSIILEGITGFVVPLENVEVLAKKIIQLLTDHKLREDMGKAAGIKVKEYEWSNIAARDVQIYHEAITNFHKQKY